MSRKLFVVCRYLICLSYQEPTVSEIVPKHGPMFGGTLVTLTGRYLHSGIQRDVFIADNRCDIQR